MAKLYIVSSLRSVPHDVISQYFEGCFIVSDIDVTLGKVQEFVEAVIKSAKTSKTGIVLLNYCPYVYQYINNYIRLSRVREISPEKFEEIITKYELDPGCVINEEFVRVFVYTDNYLYEVEFDHDEYCYPYDAFFDWLHNLHEATLEIADVIMQK